MSIILFLLIIILLMHYGYNSRKCETDSSIIHPSFIGYHNHY
jgi:hypothetical protein